ncbi:MAG: CHAP domain-containing protein [Candidatus Saccharibacteria bacterium]
MMLAGLLLKKSKLELIIVLTVILVLFSMPIVVLAAVSDLGVIDTHPLYTGPIDTRDAYAYGNCTYWAALRRIQIGQPIPSTWGNANTWAERAQLDGYLVDHIPAMDSIMQTSAGELGHVAFVESVDTAGNWTISEMNVVGFDQLDTRTLSAAAAQNFNFIH